MSKRPKPNLFPDVPTAIASELRSPLSRLCKWKDGYLVRNREGRLVDQDGTPWGVQVFCFEPKTDTSEGKYRLHLVPVRDDDERA